MQVQDLTADEELRLAIAASRSEREVSSAESAAARADASAEGVEDCDSEGHADSDSGDQTP